MKDENQIAVIQGNEELVKLYQESAHLGSQNLQGAIPTLKVHTTNKSLGNELSDGKEPNDGWFFLTGKQVQFENPLCHILTISKGFRAEGMVDKSTGEKGGSKFNQILGGVIINGADYEPFIMYFTGIKLSKLWEFGKEINKYTHAKPIPIPMFALTVKLSTFKVKHEFGSSYAVNFEIVKNGDFPQLVTDPGQFTFLKDSLKIMEDTINSLIETKSSEKDEVRENVVEEIGKEASGEEKVPDVILEEEPLPF